MAAPHICLGRQTGTDCCGLFHLPWSRARPLPDGKTDSVASDRKDLKVVKDECRVFNLIWIIEWGHPDGLQMGTSPEAAADLKRWLHLTSALGCKLVRIVAGYSTYRGREPVPTQMVRLIPLLREMCQEAADLGIVLALENHADFTPLELVELIGQVGAPNLRATFDMGNCVRLDADLIESTRCIAPITEIVHLDRKSTRLNSSHVSIS